MPPSFLARWSAERRLRRNAAAYTRSQFQEPDERDTGWLASRATGGDLDRARWELRYARRALALLAAQRDALDDRTGSAVAREMAEQLTSDRNVGAGMTRLVERQFNARLRTYADALSMRTGTSAEPAAVRLGRALLLSSGITAGADQASVARAGDLLSGYMADANESLRAIFGVASLPEHLPPSVAQSEASRAVK